MLPLGLLSLDLDADEDGSVTAQFAVHDQVVSIKQRPEEGRTYDEAMEDRQAWAQAHPEQASAFPGRSASGEYESAFPNVGLVLWQSGLVLGEWLLRMQPVGAWQPQPGCERLRVLELGCGVGQLGVVLGLAGARVLLTDLAHITPLTQANIELNASRCAIRPQCCPYMWGDSAAVLEQQLPSLQQLGQQQPGQQQPEQQPAGEPRQQGAQSQQAWHAIVATDVLYEPQHYGALLASLCQLCPPPAGLARSPPVFIAYRVRRYGEHEFEAKARRAGFSVEAVPLEQLHEDFRCGGYRLIRLARSSAGGQA